MPRGIRAHQLDFGIIYLRLARREFCAAAIAAARPRRFPRRSPRVPRARDGHDGVNGQLSMKSLDSFR